MSEPRLTSSFQISALKRLTEADGGFATVICKGDAIAGAILLIGQIRGKNPVLFERVASMDGVSDWQAVTTATSENGGAIRTYWQKRRSSDPDLWVIELDVASPERLAGLLAASY